MESVAMKNKDVAQNRNGRNGRKLMQVTDGERTGKVYPLTRSLLKRDPVTLWKPLY